MHPVDRPGAELFEPRVGLDANAKIQTLMAHRVIEHLDELAAHPRSILELGCGTGLLTALLIDRFPDAKITAVDFSPKMIEAARARIEGSDQLELVLVDIEEYHAASDFDLIVSNAAIQWLSAPEKTMTALMKRVVPSGLMVHHTFGPRTFRELEASMARVAAQLGGGQARRGIGLRSVTAWHELFRRAGAQSIAARSRDITGHHENSRAFLEELRGTGASYTPDDRHGPSFIARVMQDYDQQYTTDLGVPATYEVLEFSATRGAV